MTLNVFCVAGSRVGVVGAGAMGGPIARHIASAGHDVSVYDVPPDAVEAAEQAGAAAAAELADLRACEVVLLLVPADDDILDAGGALAPLLPAGATIVICSSARPETCRRLGDTARVRAAEAGSISLLVGGEPEVVTRLDSVFGAFCARVTHLGPLGCGQVGKTVNNLLHWATIAAITEAFTLGERLGVPAPRLRAALIGGPTDSRTLRGARPVPPDLVGQGPGQRRDDGRRRRHGPAACPPGPGGDAVDHDVVTNSLPGLVLQWSNHSAIVV